jgi:hypothetical protein
MRIRASLSGIFTLAECPIWKIGRLSAICAENRPIVSDQRSSHQWRNSSQLMEIKNENFSRSFGAPLARRRPDA